jgi:hypothetical protein
MTKKRKRPRRSSALDGDDAESLSPPLTDPTKRFRHSPRVISEEELFRPGFGLVAFTRPAAPPPAVAAAEPVERKPRPAKPRHSSKRQTTR